MFEPIAIDLGDAVKLPVTFKVDGTLTDPGALTFELKSPGGSTTTYTYSTGASGFTWTKNATGDYHVVITATVLNVAGVWNYSYISTGTAAGAEQGKITVTARASA